MKKSSLPKFANKPEFSVRVFSLVATGAAAVAAGCYFFAFQNKSPDKTQVEKSIVARVVPTSKTQPKGSLFVASSPLVAAPGKQTKVQLALSALESKDPTFVRIQLARVGHCANVSQLYDSLMLAKSGVFNGEQSQITPEVQLQKVAAASRIIDECAEYITVLGTAKLRQLRRDLQTHGMKVGNFLFDENSLDDMKSGSVAYLIKSGDPALVSTAVSTIVRVLPTFEYTPDGKGQVTEEFEKNYHLWDRALMIAGCNIGNYCSSNSLNAQYQCLYANVCGVDIDAFWLQGLGAEDQTIVKQRSSALTAWLRTASIADISKIKEYTDLASATK